MGFLCVRCFMVRIKAGLVSFKSALLEVLMYVMVFLLLIASVAFLCHKFYGFQNHIDWVLATIYACLSVFSFYVFAINDMHAKNFKGRTMALSFLTVHLALMVLVMSFIFATPVQLTWYLAGLFFGLSYLFGFYGLNEWSKRHNRSKQLMQNELLTDELTQLFNRRAMAQHALKEEQFCQMMHSQLSMMIIDIDDFKKINDQYGHAVGDVILVQISELFQHHVNESGSIYRWGGEEFVVMLPVTGLFEAKQIAKKLTRKVAEHEFSINSLLTLSVTISVGVAQWIVGESICKETLERADKALYKAKSTGKNAVVVADFTDISHTNKGTGLTKQASIF